MLFMDTTLSLLAGALLDFLLGDPYRLPHPVRLMGNMTGFLEKKLRRKEESPGRQMLAGSLLFILVLLASGGMTFLILFLLYRWSRLLGILGQTMLCYQMMATKCLKVESMKVYEALYEGNLPKARQRVAMIVGRDTKDLTGKEIMKAAVETIAENTSDGSIAPLCYLALGGPVLGVLYKAVNTMDSMIGYKNEAYLYFGRVAARADDMANFIPARIAAGLMLAAAFLLGYDYKRALQVYRRDRKKQASPNSAQTESVCAGALGIRLAGDAWYFGKRVKKEYIGNSIREIEPEDIKRANRLLYTTVLLFLGLVIITRMGIGRLYGIL